MSKRKSQYSGTLDEPIPGPRSMKLPVTRIFHGPMFPELTTDEELKWLIELARIENEKLNILLAHYDIAEELPVSIRCMRLALALAREHVPGFRIQARPGRPRKHKPEIKPAPKGNGKRGRPLIASGFERRMFVRMVDEYRRIHGVTTDKAALEAMYDDRLRASDRIPLRADIRARDVKALQKYLSSCRAESKK